MYNRKGGYKIMKSKVDKTWSIKEEGKLNKDNIIFKDPKIRKLVEAMKKVDDEIKKSRLKYP
tara:strand:- start:18203 stop:18388 length:186 start_codon:yes stop_codon:yes gene_type:complete